MTSEVLLKRSEERMCASIIAAESPLLLDILLLGIAWRFGGEPIRPTVPHPKAVTSDN